ncbi:unnamed protein product [Caenorhabditis sp. 36 PRJEB53466]|nr:unnamed protein product [Caenorhabditis sp. 36 PRJEB53466]
MMANAVEMQQLLMSMDPSSASQFGMMNKGGACVLTTSGGSASPTSSTGAASMESDEKEQLQQHLLQNGLAANPHQWMALFQQQHQLAEAKMKTGGGNDVAEQTLPEKNLIDFLTNPNMDLMKIAAQFAQQKAPENDVEEQRESTPTPPPAVSLNSTLAAMMLPTTSTSAGCSAASTASTVDSTASTVIVNGNSGAAALGEEEEQPPMKKQKSREETPVTPTAPNNLMQSLLAQIGGFSQLQQQQSQKQMKDDSLMFGNLFPQGMAGLPLMFPPSLQQFAGMPEFDPLANALNTPNKGSGVKRHVQQVLSADSHAQMHGIVIDENKTVIANIDTLVKEREGELSFRCDTCRTMFKTRNQLRQHRQDMHGVLPLSTPRNNQNKSSVPSTPTGANNNQTVNTPATPLDEKCAMCEKRVPSGIMAMHMAQEHIGNIAASVSAPDLNQVMALISQVAQRTQSIEEKEPQVLSCTECGYKCRDEKNLEMHQMRHIKMSEAKTMRDDEEDVALKMTTEAALQMVVQNQNQMDGDSSAAALNLTFKNDVKKEEVEEEKAVATQHERNSHTSGSISPSGSIPEGFGRPVGDKLFPTQSFLAKSHDETGCFLGEFLVQLPDLISFERSHFFLFHSYPPPSVISIVNMMVIPVSQHKLIKIRRVNRDRLTKFALICSAIACGCNTLCSSTNHWLYTSEVLKYFVFPNQTLNFDDSSTATAPVYFKNATIGPWLFCWADPITPFHCSTVYYWIDEEPSDTTTSVQQSVRRAFLFMLVGMILDGFGLVMAVICYCLKNPYASLLASSLLHINSGIANFSCIIVYMSAVSKEVGNKIHAASEMDDPLFYMSYGFSFWCLKASFLFTELAALFSIIVYMAKRDERTFNRYKIRATFNLQKKLEEPSDRQLSILTESSNTRFNRRTGSHTASDSPPPELDSMMNRLSSDRALQMYKSGMQGSFSLLADSFSHLPDSSVHNGRRASRKQPTPNRNQPLRRFAIPVAQGCPSFSN